ncbi:ATP-binding protein [Streptomyces sp. CdTB01]|uniref:ATP-binding protein n=1 Tax=Streptomyces sp. CdTB01 TaxID=1725411 RepID=UPI00073A70FB|nr:ATP-binding protein [Streptomyces sp. CdTB01]ALV31327.1 regulator [Streptomyces sp. CdTB01]
MDLSPVRKGETTASEQGLETSITLDGDGTCIAQARHLAADFLTRRAGHVAAVSARVGEVVQLVVSELVTNAYKYAPGPVMMVLRITGEAVEVEVWDSDRGLPESRPADPGRVGQHGLEIVKVLATGFEVRQVAAGKCVAVRIALTDDPETAGPPRPGR